MQEHAARHNLDVHFRLLVLRCQAGDEEAFAQLMGEFSARTLRYLRGMVGDAADDVQQELWIGVYRKIATLASPGAFRTWLYRTTRHKALDFLRRHQRERELLDDSPVEALDVRAPEEEDAALTESMLSVLGSMTPAHREVLQLRYLDSMSYAEIALVTGCSIGTVRSRLHYAKQRLQGLLEHGNG